LTNTKRTELPLEQPEEPGELGMSKVVNRKREVDQEIATAKEFGPPRRREVKSEENG
jgi:hypothetical protein